MKFGICAEVEASARLDVWKTESLPNDGCPSFTSGARRFALIGGLAKTFPRGSATQ